MKIFCKENSSESKNTASELLSLVYEFKEKFGADAFSIYLESEDLQNSLADAKVSLGKYAELAHKLSIQPESDVRFMDMAKSNFSACVADVESQVRELEEWISEMKTLCDKIDDAVSAL